MNSDLLSDLLRDFEAEAASLVDALSDLSASDWDASTPAPGWGIREQVSHLAVVDRRAALAASDPDAFEQQASRDRTDVNAFEREQASYGQSMSEAEILPLWQAGRRDLVHAARSASPAMRVPWYGPAMSLPSLVTARIMEYWAHGCDIRDALGLPLSSTGRLRHIARMGFQTRGWSYVVNDLRAPDVPILVHLTHDGEDWFFGPQDATQQIAGSAIDFCLVVTQRRHLNDVALSIMGNDARRWMQLAQAYAGAAGPGRAPLRSAN
jgi:uncharacterized protein (TIGR03084 family)